MKDETTTPAAPDPHALALRDRWRKLSYAQQDQLQRLVRAGGVGGQSPSEPTSCALARRGLLRYAGGYRWEVTPEGAALVAAYVQRCASMRAAAGLPVDPLLRPAAATPTPLPRTP